MMDNYVITIARGYGSGGRTIGQMLAKELNINYYDKELARIASDASGIDEKLFNMADERVSASPFRKPYTDKIVSADSDEFISDNNLFNFQAKIIRDLADKESCVIVGRCADFVLRDKSNVTKIYIYASHDACVKNVVDMYAVSEKEAKKIIQKTDKIRSTYYKHYTGHEWDNAKNYDLCLNSSELGFEKCVEIIKSYLQVKNK